MKFSGQVGFWMEDVEVRPGIYKSYIEERSYYGDVIRNQRRWQEADQLNSVMKVNNSISICSDLFARQNFNSIKYVVWNGVRLKVNSVTIDYPRITLDIGGVYNNENSPEST